jgi:hypothetical protein
VTAPFFKPRTLNSPPRHQPPASVGLTPVSVGPTPASLDSAPIGFGSALASFSTAPLRFGSAPVSFGSAPWHPNLSFESAQKAKTERVEEIVRRAAQLQPPIPEELLRQMPAFQAAHNIPRPLEDSEWPQLQMRFQEQRARAELSVASIQRGTVQVETKIEKVDRSQGKSNSSRHNF